MRQYQWAYLLARLPVGMAFFGHGLARMPKLPAFSGGMAAQFSKSWLPQGLVIPFSYVVPFAELLAGILLLAGLFTRSAIVLGWLLILALIFGSCLIEQWENVFIQLVYGAYLAVLFLFLPYNGMSVDGRWKK